MAEAVFLPLRDGTGRYRHAWRLHLHLHLHLDVDRHVPAAWELTDARNTGKSDEKDVLRRKLAPGHTHVMDRWYARFTLWNDIRAAGSTSRGRWGGRASGCGGWTRRRRMRSWRRCGSPSAGGGRAGASCGSDGGVALGNGFTLRPPRRPRRG